MRTLAAGETSRTIFRNRQAKGISWPGIIDESVEHSCHWKCCTVNELEWVFDSTADADQTSDRTSWSNIMCFVQGLLGRVIPAGATVSILNMSDCDG